MNTKAEKAPLKIAFLTPQYVTESNYDGGLSSYLERVAVALHEAGHRPEIFTLSEKNDSLVVRGVRVHRVRPLENIAVRVIHRVLRETMRSSWSLTADTLKGALGLSRALSASSIQADVVQASDFMAPGLFVRPPHGTLITRLSSISKILNEYDRQPMGRDRAQKTKLEMKAVLKSRSIYAPSSFVARFASEEYQRPVEHIMPPIDPDYFVRNRTNWQMPSSAPYQPYVLYFGRLSPAKGVDLLVKSLPQFLKRFPACSFVFAGRTRDKEFEQTCRQALGEFSKRVVFTGVLKPDELYPLIEKAEFVVLPSVVENTPNAAVEAMSLGKVVAAPRGVGFDDLIIDGHTGVNFESQNVEDMGHAMASLMSMSVEQRGLMGQRSREHLGQFSPERVVPQLLDFYYTAIGHANHHNQSV